MNCKKCGSPLTENDKFCTNCGEVVDAQVEQANVLNTDALADVAAPAVSEPVPVMQEPVAAPVVEPVAGPVAEPTAAPPATPQAAPAAKNNNVLYIVIGLVVVAVLIAGAIIFSSLRSGNNGGNGGNSGDVNVTPTTAKSYKVSFGGYNFYIPDSLVYETKETSLIIGDSADTWIFALEVANLQFDKIKAGKDRLKSALTRSGYTPGALNVKSYGGLEFVSIEASKGGSNALLAYAPIDSVHIAALTVYDKDNGFSYDVLTSAASIISGAEASSGAVSIAPKSNIDQAKIIESVK